MNAYKNYPNATAHEKHLQIVFLKNEGLTAKEIADITGYAKTTVSNYIYKYYEDFIDEARKYYNCTAPTLLAETFEKGTQQIYLVKFYSATGKIVFTKIGTTKRYVETRIKEEIKYYQDRGINFDNVIIEKVIDCGEYEAEMVESYLRFRFIKKYRNWMKNDRFLGINISEEEFTKEVEYALS